MPGQKPDKSYSDSFESSVVTTNLPSASINTAKKNTASTSKSVRTVTTTNNGKSLNTKHDKDDESTVSIKTQLDAAAVQSTTGKNDEFSIINENLNETGVSEASTVSSATTATNATTANTANELELKVKELKDELIKKKNEAEKLRQTLKLKEKNKLKEKEEFLRKKINSYDNLIGKIKVALDKEPVAAADQTWVMSNRLIQILPMRFGII